MLIRLGQGEGAATRTGCRSSADRAGAGRGGGRRRGQPLLRALGLRLAGAQGRDRGLARRRASRAAPARSRCRPRRTCSSGPTAACCARRSRRRSRRRSSCSGPSGGSSRSISTSSSSGPASTAPRPRRSSYFGKPAAELDPREAALLAAALPSPGAPRPRGPSAYLERRARTIRDPDRPARPDAGLRARAAEAGAALRVALSSAQRRSRR